MAGPVWNTLFPAFARWHLQMWWNDDAERRTERTRTGSSWVSDQAPLVFHLSLSRLPCPDLSCHRASLCIIIGPFLAGCVAHLRWLSTQRPEKDDTVRTMLTQQLRDCWCHTADVSLTHHGDDFAQTVRESSTLSPKLRADFPLHALTSHLHLFQWRSKGTILEKIDKNEINTKGILEKKKNCH